MIAGMADQKYRPSRARRPDPHTAPYPQRLHAHLRGAVEALATLALPAASVDAGLPTPAELVRSYGGSEGVNTSQSEGGENE